MFNTVKISCLIMIGLINCIISLLGWTCLFTAIFSNLLNVFYSEFLYFFIQIKLIEVFLLYIFFTLLSYTFPGIVRNCSVSSDSVVYAFLNSLSHADHLKCLIVNVAI